MLRTCYTLLTHEFQDLYPAFEVEDESCRVVSGIESLLSQSFKFCNFDSGFNDDEAALLKDLTNYCQDHLRSILLGENSSVKLNGISIDNCNYYSNYDFTDCEQKYHLFLYFKSDSNMLVNATVSLANPDIESSFTILSECNSRTYEFYIHEDGLNVYTTATYMKKGFYFTNGESSVTICEETP